MKTYSINFAIILCLMLQTIIQASNIGPAPFTKSFNFKNFDKVYFKNINGDIEVVIGKTWSVNIDATDEQLLNFVFDNDAKENKLKIDYQPKGKYNYYEKKINIYITMPESSVISNEGNGDIEIKNVVGRYFRYEKNGNGDALIIGNVDTFDLKSSGNGDINAKNINAKICEVKANGNGNISVNSQISLSVQGSGNGDVIQFGEGKVSTMSGIIGNGEIIKK